MKLKKIIAISSAALLLAGVGLTLGLTIGLNEKTPPIIESGLTGSTGVKMAWSDLVDNKVVNVKEGILNVDNAEVEKLCPNDTTFTLEIPEAAGVVKIGFDAFNECMKLTSITIPTTVIEIDTDAFYNCDNLTTVTFTSGSKLTTIGYGAFTYCEKLNNIQIPETVTRIDQSAFIGCKGLKSITLPSGINVIESHVFKDCESLESVTLNGTVTKIEPYAFYNCSSLTTIDNIIKDVTVIQNSAFIRCDKLQTINFGSSLTEIEFDAFMDCQSLKNVTFGSNQVTFGLGIFRNCINLTDITLPINTSTISDYMFYNCEDLTSFTVGTNVTYIGYRAFMNCFNLSITFEDINWLYSDNKELTNLEEITLDSSNSNKLIEELADCYFIMKCNQITISSLDKIYDGNSVDYPTINTRDGYVGIASPDAVVNGQNLVIIWSYYDSEGAIHQMEDGKIPTAAGKYNIQIIYPETEEYLSFTSSKDFNIIPVEITVTIESEVEFAYDGLAHNPVVVLSVNFLLQGTDYEVLYFVKNEENNYNNEEGTVIVPTEVGDYVMRIVLIENGANNAKFDIENDITEKDIYYSILVLEDFNGDNTNSETGSVENNND